MIETYKDLRIYQISMELLEKLYEIAYKIPHIKYTFRNLEKFFRKMTSD